MPDARWTDETRTIVERAIEEHSQTAIAVFGHAMRHECGCGQWWRPLDDDDWAELHDAHRANAVLATLADRGLLLPEGTKSRTVWGTRVQELGREPWYIDWPTEEAARADVADRRAAGQNASLARCTTTPAYRTPWQPAQPDSGTST